MESSRGECERRIGDIKSSVGRMCKLTEVFWEKIVKRHPTIKRKLIKSLTAAWNRGVTHVHLVKLSIQFRHNAQNRLRAKAGPEYTNPSSKRKSGLLGATT